MEKFSQMNFEKVKSNTQSKKPKKSEEELKNQDFQRMGYHNNN
jgi:hypothetical protein